MLILAGGAADDGAGAAGSGPGRARWRERPDVAPAWRARLLQAMAAPSALARHCAGAVARAHGQHDAAAWLATPVHVAAGIDRAFLSRDGLLRLDADEWRALCAGFERHFGGDGLRLHRVADDAALLLGAAIGELRTDEPYDCLGEDLRLRLPVGTGAARWRALAGEVEMWLHGEAWNRERERHGRLPVTTLWLWGGPVQVDDAPWPSDGDSSSRPAAHWWLVGDDPWLAALPALHRDCALRALGDYDALLQADGRPQAAAVLWRADRGLDELERRWLGPARRALDRGALARLSLHHRRRCWQLDRAARWRWWQPHRSLAQLAAVTHG